MMSIRLRRRERRLSCLTGLPRGFPPGGAGLDTLVFQRISEPAGTVAALNQQPLCLWHAAQQRGSAGVAGLACGHEELERASIGISAGMQFGVHSAFGSAAQSTSLVAGSPFCPTGWQKGITPIRGAPSIANPRHLRFPFARRAARQVLHPAAALGCRVDPGRREQPG